MHEISQNDFKKIYITFFSLRKNVPDWLVEEKYAHDFNNNIMKLQNSWYDLEEFKIPATEMRQIETSVITDFDWNTEVNYSDKKFVDHNYFMLQLDKVLGFFELYNEPETKIGFKLN